MSALPAERPWMTIGEVLSLVSRDFPEITISKIRFLEGEGLISPHRAKSGYRRFTDDDVDQLRLVLVAQRDRYLPLRVIKDHLAAGTLRQTVYPEPQVEVQVQVPALEPEVARPLPDIDPRATFLRSQMEEQSGLEPAQFDALCDAGVIGPDQAGRFTGADVMLCRAYAVLAGFGVDHRHMRQAKNVASRESYLIGNAVGHLQGEERTEAVGQMLDALSNAHYWLILGEVNRQSPSNGHRPRGTSRG